jgi:hypothetical protein
MEKEIMDSFDSYGSLGGKPSDSLLFEAARELERRLTTLEVAGGGAARADSTELTRLRSDVDALRRDMRTLNDKIDRAYVLLAAFNKRLPPDTGGAIRPPETRPPEPRPSVPPSGDAPRVFIPSPDVPVGAARYVTTESSRSPAPPEKVFKPETAPLPPDDDISPLFTSADKRDDRKRRGLGDAFVSIQSDAYEALKQGGEARIVFDKSNPYVSKFAVVDDRKVYPNFFNYHENKPLDSADKAIFAAVFDITGDLPGCVNACAPASVTRSGDNYILQSKGKIFLQTSSGHL